MEALYICFRPVILQKNLVHRQFNVFYSSYEILIPVMKNDNQVPENNFNVQSHAFILQ